MTSSAFLACTVATALALGAAGCASKPAAPAPGAATPVASTSSSIPSAELLQPHRVDIPGLTFGTSSTEGGDLLIHSRWAIIPGTSALNAAVQTWANAEEEEFRSTATPFEGAKPEINIDSYPVLASGGVAGVKVNEFVIYGVSPTERSRTFYGSADGQWSVDGPGLFAEQHRESVISALLSAMPAAEDSFVQELSDRRDLLRDVLITPAGEVIFTLDQGTAAAKSEGVLTATLRADALRPWLSARGADVLEAALSKAPWQGSTGSATSMPSTPAGAGSPAASAVPSSTGASARPSAGGAGGTGGAAGAVDCASRPCVALTYDDGPSQFTGQLLDILAAAGVPATLYVVGTNVGPQAALLKRADAQGIEIGNHTWSHRDLAKLTAAQQEEELTRTADAITAAIGKRPVTMRPPYGSFSQDTRTLGYPIINWDVDTEDWKNRNATTTTERALASAQAGSVILMHDIHKSSVEATPGIIAALKDKGFTLVTVTQLLGSPKAGTVYFSRARTS